MQTALFLATAVLVFQIYFWVRGCGKLCKRRERCRKLILNVNLSFRRNLPLISVIVPAHDEQTGIAACLQSVLDQDYPCFELIFVNDRSSDNKLAIAESVTPGKKTSDIIRDGSAGRMDRKVSCFGCRGAASLRRMAGFLGRR